MSLPQSATFTCPNCHKTYKGQIWGSVNTDLSDDLPEKIISGEFFRSKCPHCGLVFHVEYDVLYHDMKHGAWIWVINKENEEYAKKISELHEATIRLCKSFPDMIVRVVNNHNQLREKVAALEAGRDDRIVELCKVILSEMMPDEHPGFQVHHAFYTYQGQEEFLYFYDAEGTQISAYLGEKNYQIIKKLFKPNLDRLEEFFPPIFDSEWAKSFILAANASNRVEKRIFIEELFEKAFNYVISEGGCAQRGDGKYLFTAETLLGHREGLVSFSDIEGLNLNDLDVYPSADPSEYIGMLKNQIIHLLSCKICDSEDIPFLEAKRKIREAEYFISLGEESPIFIHEAEKNGLTPAQFLRFEQLLIASKQQEIERMRHDLLHPPIKPELDVNAEIRKLEALINEAEAALSLEKTSAEFQRKADEAGMAPDQYEKFQQISLECNLRRLNELQPTKTQTSNAKNGSARKEQKSSKMTFLNFLNRFRK